MLLGCRVNQRVGGQGEIGDLEHRKTGMNKKRRGNKFKERKWFIQKIE